MLDRDLADLYESETKALNLAVKRNIRRFPKDFMFQLTKEEYEGLRFQIESLENQHPLRLQNETLKSGRGKHSKYLPYAFTEQGVAMLSSVLNSDRAIEINIQIMRVFTKLREMMISHKDLARKIEDLERKFQEKFEEHDKKIILIFNAIKELLAGKAEVEKNRGPMGFIPPRPPDVVNKLKRK